jgi:ribosomal protein L36
MNWYSQLTKLIFDYYREDPSELKKLQALNACKLSRRWGVMRIICRDLATAQALTAADEILLEPIAQLRLAKEVRILSDRILIATLPVDAPKLMR